MNLRRQLLLVSLLALMLPWAGCEFIRETEIALREGQQQMLGVTARAIASSVSQYREEFPVRDPMFPIDDQLYVHELVTRPEVDGYFDDWNLADLSLRSMRGVDGPTRFALGTFGQGIYVYIEVEDSNVAYGEDGVVLMSSSPPYLQETFAFKAEAPGRILSRKNTERGFEPEPTIEAWWQDVPGGYRVEARIPAGQLGTNLGIIVSNAGVDSASYVGRYPGPTRQEVSELVRCDRSAGRERHATGADGCGRLASSAHRTTG